MISGLSVSAAERQALRKTPLLAKGVGDCSRYTFGNTKSTSVAICIMLSDVVHRIFVCHEL